jgi:S-adenosylmethionine synthetase
MADTYLFTSESVAEGHPDKVADRISDAILDSILTHDPHARVACETLVTTGLVVLAGEVTVHNDAARRALDQAEDTARAAIRAIGYQDDPGIRFEADSCAVIRTLHAQSADIAMGVDRDGAGDQGLMFGFACDETEDLMPLPIHLAHRLVERQAAVRRLGERGGIPGLRPDAKSQVTIEYDTATGKALRVDSVVLSTQHTPAWNGAAQDELRQLVLDHIILPVLPRELWSGDRRKVVINPQERPSDPSTLVCHINPTGQFEIGGPHGDTGLTGRKVIVDSYGGWARHGGGAFSGKDPTKVDRSAAYMARHIAKNLVAAGLCARCEVQLSYAIGVAEPTSVLIDTQGTNTLPEKQLTALVREHFPLTPRGILAHLCLRAPIYTASSSYGHFGRKPVVIDVAGVCHEAFSWENTRMASKLREAAKR